MPEAREVVMGVVIPARNEEALLAGCLASVLTSKDELVARGRATRVHVVVALDRCTDATEQIARAAGVDVVRSPRPGVGEARRAGVDRIASWSRGRAASEVWICCTDADTVVPLDWLDRHAAAARSGGTLMVGRVVPDPDDLSAELLAAWRSRHPHDVVGAHVHGANLGFRLDTYRAAGGFPAVHGHEDRQLVATMLLAGATALDGGSATTSGRSQGRVEEGFSGYLRDLASAVEVTRSRPREVR